MIDPRSPDFTDTPVSPKRRGAVYAPSDPLAPPLVSVVTPFFNTSPGVFAETARCVLGQSWQQWEWLIVNDASSEPESLAVLAEYRARDPRIRVLDLAANQGPGEARNAGFAAARGEYVYQLDDDDLLEPTALEKAYFFLESNPEYAFVNAWSVAFGGQEYLWSEGFEQGPRFLQSNCVTNGALLRRSALAASGGYDTSIRGGMEDWDFWLRLADRGLWGGTIAEHHHWYRRRPNHNDRWRDWDLGRRQGAFAADLRRRYPRLVDGEFPRVTPRCHVPFDRVRPAWPEVNRLAKSRPRLLMILPWLTFGGADKFNLDLVAQLIQQGWDVTIVTTVRGDHSWTPVFAHLTPDIFVLRNFLRLGDQPAFLRYLIRSRQPDVVMVSNSEFGYLLLPYLRAQCPEPAYIDYCHMEEEYYKDGGFPRYAAACQDDLDLNVVASEHLKNWMVRRGAAAERIEVVHINVDSDYWTPDPAVRARVRSAHGLAADDVVLLYPVRICAQKQPQVFARVMKALADRHLSFQALVAGDGEERPWLETYLRQNGLAERVRVLGAVSSATVRALMQASDILFLPSLWEGIALAIYEAMACGLLVVGADVGGQRELVTPDCGVLLPRAAPDVEVPRYAEVLAGLLADPVRRAALGRNARLRVQERFTLDEMGRRMADVLARVQQPRAHAESIPLSPRAALESATRAVEFMRLQEVADSLWADMSRAREHQHAATAAVSPADAQLAGLYGSTGWKVLMFLYRVRFFLFPRGSRRERFGRWGMHMQRRFRFFARQGLRPLLRATGRYFRRVLFTRSP